MMWKLWGLGKKISFKDLGPRIIPLEFEDQRDKGRVKMDGPWSFEKHLLLMKEFEGDLQMSKIQFTEASFWVHLYIEWDE